VDSVLTEDTELAMHNSQASTEHAIGLIGSTFRSELIILRGRPHRLHAFESYGFADRAQNT